MFTSCNHPIMFIFLCLFRYSTKGIKFCISNNMNVISMMMENQWKFVDLGRYHVHTIAQRINQVDNISHQDAWGHSENWCQKGCMPFCIGNWSVDAIFFPKEESTISTMLELNKAQQVSTSMQCIPIVYLENKGGVLELKDRL